MNFEMSIADVFALEGARTVFTGEVRGGQKVTSACDCELVIAGVPVARFKIEGEMIPLRKEGDLRAVSTTEEIDVALVQRAKGQCQLRCI